MNRVLFVGHNATRSGAPYVLLHLLRWLRANTSIEFRLLLLAGGELEAEFAKVSQVSIVDSGKTGGNNIIMKGLRHYGFFRNDGNTYLTGLKRELIDEGIDLIYSNTAANGSVVASLAEIGCPVITHVHEMEYVLVHTLGLELIRLMKESTSHYIVVCESVRRNLIENHSIPSNKIDLIYEFIPVQTVNSAQKAAARKKLRRELGIPDEGFIVGGSGTIDWRKGPDLFIQLASLMHRRQLDRPIWFVWLGCYYDETVYYQLCHDVKLLGLEGSVKLMGPRDDAVKYIGAFDVFVMTSREDPFPLVCLEAASMEIPIVCFDKAGGACEFVGNDSGFIVPYLDLGGMADNVAALLNSEELRSIYGRQAGHKARDYDVEIAAPKILEIIRHYTKAQ